MHPTMTIPRVNTTQACAACKYQRRKCASDCILAPYFPHDRQRQFLNAHKLFGVSNITKIIRNLDQPEKDAAMRTIIFQSDVRATDPVGGCYRIIRQLQHQIEYTKAELDFVLHQLALCRAQAHQQPQISVPDDNATTDSSTIINCEMFSSADLLGSSYEPLQINYPHFQPPHHTEQFIIQNEDVELQEVTANSWSLHGSTASSMMPISKQHSVNQCNNFKQLFEGISDDPHADFRFESEETIERSHEQTNGRAALNEGERSFHCARDHHDLQDATTLFTLTKCNT